jgi:hypothetical protein
MYWAHISRNGAVKHGQLPSSIDVYKASDDPIPIGMAAKIGWVYKGLAVWELAVRGKPLPGHWVIIDKRFVLVQ